jgi:hypothetical protein
VVKQLVARRPQESRRSLQPPRQFEKEGETKMKKTYTMIALAVLVASMAVAANAQNGGRRLVANIPFQFNVGAKTLPAGDYTIAQTNPSSNHAVLQIRTQDGTESVLVQMNSLVGKMKDGSTLVFRRYGNKYFFAQAWIAADSEGLNVPSSRSERATQKEMAALGVKTEMIALRKR